MKVLDFKIEEVGIPDLTVNVLCGARFVSLEQEPGYILLTEEMVQPLIDALQSCIAKEAK